MSLPFPPVRIALVMIMAIVPLDAGQAPQPQPPAKTFKAETNIVTVDVRVLDRAGRPIEDLTQADFRVFEDGVDQPIASFTRERLDIETPAHPDNRQAPTINLSALPQGMTVDQAIQDRRLLVLFFDQTSMPVEDLLRGLDAARTFVRSKMAAADLVAVATYTSTLRVLQDFTNDRELLVATLDHVRPGESASLAGAATVGDAGTTSASGAEAVTEDVSQAFTPDETEFNIFNSDQKLGAIESLVDMLRPVPGRKLVLHFSSGIARTGQENQAQLRAAIDGANRANVSLYTFDVRGLVALPPGGDASTSSPAGTAAYSGQAVRSQMTSLHDSRETLSGLAADTGGQSFYDTNDFATAFAQVQSENSTYYLLGYSPHTVAADGKFHRIRVEVRRPGAHVQARPGYFAAKSFGILTRAEKDLQLEQAIALDAPLVDLPIAAEVPVFRLPDGRFSVVLAAKVPGTALAFNEKSGKEHAELDFAWRVSDANGRVAGSLRDTLPVNLDHAAYSQVTAGAIVYEGGLILPAGSYALKGAVRDNSSGRIGTFEQPLQLPPAHENSALQISSIVLSAQQQPAAATRGGADATVNPLRIGSRTLVPSVTRIFRTNQMLYVYLESYGGGSSAVGANAFATPLFFRNGVKVSEAGPFVGIPDGNGRKVSYFMALPLERFKPGRYILQMNVFDLSGGRAAFARVPFIVLPAAKLPSP
jgi:VWFA-related protein